MNNESDERSTPYSSMTPTADYLIGKPEASCGMPFGDGTWVYKVAHKMYALLYRRDGKDCVNLKCDPEQAIELRDVFEAVSAGYHMNKRHWNTIQLDGDVPMAEVERMIDHSYGLVFEGLTKGQQRELLIKYPESELLGRE